MTDLDAMLCSEHAASVSHQSSNYSCQWVAVLAVLVCRAFMFKVCLVADHYCSSIARQWYFKKGVHKPKWNKLCIHWLYQAPHFSNFGVPYLRAQISACFHHR